MLDMARLGDTLVRVVEGLSHVWADKQRKAEELAKETERWEARAIAAWANKGLDDSFARSPEEGQRG